MAKEAQTLKHKLWPKLAKVGQAHCWPKSAMTLGFRILSFGFRVKVLGFRFQVFWGFRV